ncbi:MAG TPA: ABC transporter substrate-binding protein [Candidatus Desulfovibrio intestinipullorum]|uniref:ABC transporter substrate-binding protein n=1 Tax=Candidatus Desulfovibrio intestinipullorum TaxID=2838536 RepID=A0A9D1PWD9_9BACT|nr:ABC transporter substrate-binding protein [Candidatus Desulfovibrio intestinipullorum]
MSARRFQHREGNGARYPGPAILLAAAVFCVCLAGTLQDTAADCVAQAHAASTALTPTKGPANPAVHPDPGQARVLLHTSISRVLSLIKNPNYVNPATRPVVRRQIEDEVYHIFDFMAFSAHTLGKDWQRFSQRQRENFSTAFANLLFSTYLNRVDGYNGEEVRYVGERRNRAGTRVEVLTEVSMQDGSVMPIAYRMMATADTWVVYDVFIEGVSLVENYRVQFREVLASSSPDGLIARVQERARRVEAGHDR